MTIRPAMTRRLALLMLGTALACALGACSPGGTMPESNDKLDRSVLDAARNGTELRLSDATDFEWDQAGFITEGTPATEIESAFGEAITREKRYTASPALFVFLKDGKVAKAIRITPDAFSGSDAKKKYGRDVALVPVEGRSGYLAWRE
ncbi:hypothetical protein [Arthrobacter cupressi]|uniref:Lipoprotein n=1 Tax=Arthrobacter cupressi TaxID=1045773 RepID=A0A1G8LN03_9MICC|nr:hypothetical protein [Arthrobacter cupressi]NYD77571.1 alkyl sulfatase BDS1-like metallo-beta-lactamase superfamily hydrolase [Arthrobacter cupressi]SDI57078.1 hypothetical protein SAMN05216555_103119 [Arthrobacter cupressi]